MSHVTDLILATMVCGDEPGVQAYMELTGIPFVLLSGAAGGHKCMQTNVHLATMNYLDINKVVAALNDVKWKWPESVQLFVKDEHESAFWIATPNAVANQ